MKRVAILFEYPSVNGGENSMLAALQHLASNAATEFHFAAIAPGSGALPDRLDELGIERQPLSIFADDGQRRPRDVVEDDIRTAVAELRPNLLHANSLSMGRWLGRIAHTLDVPVTAHLRDIIGLSNSAIRDLNRNVRLIAVSDATRDFHVAQGIEPARICVVRNGINADSFAPCERSRRAVRSELAIPEEAITVLTAGQIGLRKGLDTLAEAAVSLSATHSGIHWLLAGERFSTKAESIAFEQAIDQRFRSAGNQLTYHRLGWRSDMHRVMSAADMLVHAARQEPLGRVLLEAAAAGLAIVATDVGGTSEILRHEESALLVPPDQPRSMAAAIKGLVEDQNARLRLGHAARLDIQSGFQLENSALRLAAEWSL
uniref:Glycosyltransferase n=1 Tax=uncultured myxobacterium HF0200_08J13 TaxID=723558 RepID=E7C3P5_9BACT|nr:glycosyltransferase [uncultured myxobacterium HF0200_08J13]